MMNPNMFIVFVCLSSAYLGSVCVVPAHSTTPAGQVWQENRTRTKEPKE